MYCAGVAVDARCTAKSHIVCCVVGGVQGSLRDIPVATASWHMCVVCKYVCACVFLLFMKARVTTSSMWGIDGPSSKHKAGTQSETESQGQRPHSFV